MQNNLQHHIALHLTPKIGSATIAKLKKNADSLAAVFKFSENKLKQCGLSAQQAQAIKQCDWQQVDETLRWAEEKNHHIISIEDAAYPALLKEINSPPFLLFIIGDPKLLSTAQLAIVGSRHPTPVGRDTAKQFAEYLAQHELTVTSGLALGIDGASHEGALPVGKTIAVLGTGLNYIYPARHRSLAEQIAENGALVSEFPLETRANAENFPQRNRIISGLSLGTLVVEAAIRSGSLITAHYAVEQGREVFAVPGSIHNPLAKGCHKLLREGAKLVEQASDILEELGALYVSLRASEHTAQPEQLGFDQELDSSYQTLLKCIDDSATPLALIKSRSEFSAEVLSSMLLQLELQGLIKSVPGGYLRNPLKCDGYRG